MTFPKKYASAALNFLAVVGLSVLALIVLSCSKANAQVPTYGHSLPKNLHQQKTYWFPGGVCYIQRSTYSPEMVTFATTLPDRLTLASVRACMLEAQKLRWQETVPFVPVLVYDSLREARTTNMACMISSSLNTPTTYQVRFAAVSLIGKAKELEECMTRTSHSPDKAKLPPQPAQPPMFHPSGYQPTI